MIDNKTLKEAQVIMLDILIEVDKICKKHNIKYWLDSGTLLGAVRHKGFIPWDDDLDISMSIDDYNKFCEIAQSELPKGLFLQTVKTDLKFPYDIAKVRSNKGSIVEEHEKNTTVAYNQGIFIDIIPVIFIKENLFFKFLYKSLFLLIKLFSYKYLNIKSFREIFIYLADSMHNSKNKIVIRSGRFPSPLLYIEKNSVFPLKNIIFEKYEFFAPNNSREYLEILYGKNYMELPPINKRDIHAYKIEIFNEQK